MECRFLKEANCINPAIRGNKCAGEGCKLKAAPKAIVAVVEPVVEVVEEVVEEDVVESSDVADDEEVEASDEVVEKKKPWYNK